MTLREMRAVLLDEAVERAYQGHKRAEGGEEGSAAWAQKNRGAAALLAQAMKAYHAIED